MQPYIAVPTNSNISVAKLPPTTRRINFPYLDSSRIPRIVVNHSAVAAIMPVNPFQNRTIALFNRYLLCLHVYMIFVLLTLSMNIERNKQTFLSLTHLKIFKHAVPIRKVFTSKAKPFSLEATCSMFSSIVNDIVASEQILVVRENETFAIVLI